MFTEVQLKITGIKEVPRSLKSFFLFFKKRQFKCYIICTNILFFFQNATYGVKS